MSYAYAHIEGNLTDTPKVLKINGKDAVEINIATNFLVKGENQANFFRVIFFDPNEIAFITARGTKGSPIAVLADIRTSKKDNVNYTNYLGLRVLQLFTRTDSAVVNNPTETQPQPKQTPPAPTPAKVVAPATPNDFVPPFDDDLPF